MKFDFAQNLKSGLFWLGLFKALGQLFVWANTIIVARFLDPADYGLVGMATLITGFILLIGNFGFGSSIVQKKGLKTIHQYSLFWITFFIGIFLSTTIYIAAPIATWFFKEPDVTPLLRLSLIALFFNIIADVPISLLLRNLKYKTVGLTDFAGSLIASITVLWLAIKGFGAYSLIFGSIISGVLRVSFTCLLGRWFPKIQFQKQGLKGFFKFGGAIVTSRILWYFYSNSDYLVLAKKLGEVSFGFYSFAFNFACIPINKLQPIISPVLFSSFSQIQDDLPQVREQFLKIINFAFMFYSLIYCGMFWVIPEFITIFLGSKWEPLIPVLQILLIVQPIRAISALSPSLINALGKPGVSVKNMMVFISIMVPGFLIGSEWGMTGISLIWCIAYPLAFLIVLLNNLRVAQIPLKQYLLQLLPGLRVTLVVSVILYSFKTLIAYYWPSSDINSLWISFVGTILAGCVANFLLLWFFERNFLQTAVSFVKNRS